LGLGICVTDLTLAYRADTAIADPIRIALSIFHFLFEINWVVGVSFDAR
jgi:hypothetical protein